MSRNESTLFPSLIRSIPWVVEVSAQSVFAQLFRKPWNINFGGNRYPSKLQSRWASLGDATLRGRTKNQIPRTKFQEPNGDDFPLWFLECGSLFLKFGS